MILTIVIYRNLIMFKYHKCL